MTPYKEGQLGVFTIPLTLASCIAALAKAQILFEDAKQRSLDATQDERQLNMDGKLLKRDLINSLREQGTAKTSAEKEYADHPEWKAHLDRVAVLQERKRDADDDESLLRQRVLTLRAVMLPLTISVLPGVDVGDRSLESAVAAVVDNASEDEAFSEAAR